MVKGATLRLDSLAIKPDTTLTVYNFEVNDLHNYYVGTQEVLVHNDCIKLKALFANTYDFDFFIKKLGSSPSVTSLFISIPPKFSIDKVWKIISESRLLNGAELFKGQNLNVFNNVQRIIDNLGSLNTVQLDKLKDALTNINRSSSIIRITYEKAAKVMADYSGLATFENIITAMASSGWKQQIGSDWVLRYLSTKNVTSIKSFENLVKEGDGLFRADILEVGGRLVELKSWGANYINAIKDRAFTSQLANYFKSSANFTQVFDFDRIRFDATGFATIAEAKTTIKAQYVTLFKKDLNATYTAMGGRTSAFLTGKGILSPEDFIAAVNDPANALHNKLFSFIDVQ